MILNMISFLFLYFNQRRETEREEDIISFPEFRERYLIWGRSESKRGQSTGERDREQSAKHFLFSSEELFLSSWCLLKEIEKIFTFRTSRSNFISYCEEFFFVRKFYCKRQKWRLTRNSKLFETIFSRDYEFYFY